MQQYVCVRVPRMDDIDIGLFDYDRYNTLYFFILNADEQIYMRYGGRDGESQDTFLSLPSLELALQKGLELHEQYGKGLLPKKERPAPLFPKEIPALVERTFAKGACVECHLIGDLQNVQREADGKLDKLSQMYRSPDLRRLGLFPDVPKGLVVKEATGPVAAAGMKPGDLITAFNGTLVHTFGDLQYAYDKVPRDARQVTLTVDRAGQQQKLTVDLPVRWWWTDIRFRQLSVDARTYFDSKPLSDEEKKQLQLPANSFASRVSHIDSMAEMLKSHALKNGDIIVGVDGVQADPLADTAELFIKLRKTAGDSVTLDVLRDGQKLQMPLRTFRMSFRK